MTGWAEFALAYGVFGASHFLPRLGGLRARMIGMVGRRSYVAGYGAVSVLVLVWMIGASARAPFIEIWPQLDWTRRVPGMVMPVALFLAVIGVGTRSPVTLGSGRGPVLDTTRFDPNRPGLAALTRHPLLWALALWSLSHLPPNGDLAHVLLFGGFGAMSLAAMPVFDRRARSAMDPDEVERLFRAAPLLSACALFSAAWLRENARHLAACVVIAAVLFLAARSLHGVVIGVSPFA